MPPELSDDHVVAICEVLIDHGVEFVIIGGIAARLHDTGHATVDIDICPSTRDANLSNLAAALQGLGGRLRVEGDPEGVPFDPHSDALRQVTTMTLITEHGPLDLCFVPAGFPDGYESLCKHASIIVVGTVDLPVASRRRCLETRSRPPQGHRRTAATGGSPATRLDRASPVPTTSGSLGARRGRGRTRRGAIRCVTALENERPKSVVASDS